MMEKHNVHFQTAELGRVDQGGGGTIAYVLAEKNMDVIDAGIAVHANPLFCILVLTC